MTMENRDLAICPQIVIIIIIIIIGATNYSDSIVAVIPGGLWMSLQKLNETIGQIHYVCMYIFL